MSGKYGVATLTSVSPAEPDPTLNGRLQHHRGPDLLTLAEAAQALRISLSTAKKLARDGELPGLVGKVGNQYRVSSAKLRAEMGITD